jgi:hypothetical protein
MGKSIPKKKILTEKIGLTKEILMEKSFYKRKF